MKVAVVFILLFATVLCRPARNLSMGSSESSEEVVRRPAVRKEAALVPQTHAAPVQAASSASDESKGSSEEGAAVAPAAQDKSSSPDPTPTSDTTTDSQDSEDDDDDDETEETESEEEEDESSDSSESGEFSTPAPATVSPTVFTEEPVFETTEDPILPTIVTDPETARGDNLGGYPSDYKSIIYVEDKSYHKGPSPYKSWEYVNNAKKMAYDMTDGNDVEKSMPVYKVQALQVHSDILEEDTSTPEMESQGLDAAQDQEITPRRASLPGEEDKSVSDATTSDSSSATQEEEDETTSASSDSASAESEDEENSEEATATPGAADSDSDESTEGDSEEEGPGPDATTDMPMVVTAK